MINPLPEADGPTPPAKTVTGKEDQRPLVIAANLTSDVYTEENPPMDWADMCLLMPHEAIRSQMTMMVQSAAALPDDPSANEAWKVTLFAKWYIDYFFVSVNEHHDAEEEIFFPWIKTRTPYPERLFSKCHEELISTMKQMKMACESICRNGGKNCTADISLLKNTIPTFVRDMRSHLQEEEESIPALMRSHFTEEEENKTVDKILKAGGLALTKTFLPAILLSMQLWMTPESYDEFCKSLPMPIKHLTFKYYLPDFENVVIPMRDAPTLTKEPKLKKVGCFGIAFCFPCIL
ncbi:hypothetical protein ACHAWU_010298 [Discostella pseudostelligera]|uniref:Hemerythrin-like domain-containing protein n=1 Tax=Discostella pseudostelligera TaxID=259834 RepID=A0ABD3N593_9STRA